MSRVDTQSLLRFNAIQPNVEPAMQQPEFRTSQFVGGGVQLGQAAQKVGPSSEEAMYGALAEIAGGVQQGLNNFSDIASRIEKEKIDEAQTYFDNITLDESLTPDQKNEKYDEYLKTVSTPFLGDIWKKKVNNQMKQLWTSTQARNDFESKRYSKEFTAWLNLDANKIRPVTPELQYEFNSIYATRFPTSTDNEWFTSVSRDVKTKLDIKKAEQVTTDLRAAFDILYDKPSDEDYNRYLTTANMEEQANFKERYRTFFEIIENLEKLDPTKGLSEQYRYVYEHVRSNFLSNQPPLDELSARIMAEEIDQLALRKTKEIVDLVNKTRTPKVIREASANIASIIHTFGVDKNTGNFLTKYFSNFQNLDSATRTSTRFNLFSLMHQQLSSGSSDASVRFRALPVDKQIQEVSGLFNSWLQKDNNKAIFLRANEISETELSTFIQINEESILSSESASQSVGSTVNSWDNTLTQTRESWPYSEPTRRSENLNTVENKIANDLGISQASLRKLVTSKKEGEEKESLNPSISIDDWYGSLPAEEKENLRLRGYTQNKFAAIEKLKKDYFSTLNAVLTGASGSSSSGSGVANLAGKTESEISGKVLSDPGLRIGVRTASSNGTIDAESGRALVELNRHTANFTNWLEAQAIAYDEATKETNDGTVNPWRHPNIDLFTESGTQITEPISPSGFYSLGTSRTFLDPTKSLTPEGLRYYARLQYVATQMAILPEDTTERNKFFGEVKDLFTVAGTVGIKKLAQEDPLRFYSLVAVVNGLASTENGITGLTALGADSEMLKTMGVLLRNASRTNGGFIDISNEKNQADKSFDNFRVFAEMTFNPTATKGQGKTTPLIPGDTRETNISDVVSGIKTAATTSGSSEYRNQTVLVNLLRSLNFSDAKPDSEGLAQFGNALWDLTGRTLPKLSETNPAIHVTIPTEEGMKTVKWADMDTSQKVYYYISNLNSQYPDGFDRLLSGWLRIGQNQDMQDIRTLDVFKGSARYMLEDLLKPKAIPGLRTTPLAQYNSISFNQTGRDRLEINPTLVPDGKDIKRGDLFAKALGASLSRYQVKGQLVDESPWKSSTSSKLKVEYSTEENVNQSDFMTAEVGGVTSESQFVIDTFISQPMGGGGTENKEYSWQIKIRL